MPRSQISIRLCNEKRDRLISLANCRKKKYSDLIREQIDLLITNGTNEEQKDRIKKVIAELRQPFAFIKTEKGRAFAERERETREQIALKLEKIFNMT